MKVKKLRSDASLPTRAHNSAAYDLYACESVNLPAGQVTLVKTGIATSFPSNLVALIWDRSGMGKKGIHVFGGVVDSDYRGEWGVLLYNSTDFDVMVCRGDRIAQFVLQPVEHPPIVEIDELDETERGDGAFGSTGS